MHSEIKVLEVPPHKAQLVSEWVVLGNDGGAYWQRSMGSSAWQRGQCMEVVMARVRLLPQVIRVCFLSIHESADKITQTIWGET